jgi:acetylornithine deacetylase/succinyl-diaminopimelate desuccinylase-like protein
LLNGGHAENALPQLAEATVNCRLLPGDAATMAQERLTKTVADPKVTVTPVQDSPESPFSPLRVDVLNAITSAVEKIWGRMPVVPLMETGATDGKWFRIAGIPCYGVSALFLDINDIRAHGKDERVSGQSFYDGVRFDYELVRRIGSPPAGPLR